MNTRTNACPRLDEEVAYAGGFSHDEQVPPLKEDTNVEQALADPPPMTEVDLRDIVAQMAQSMTTQAQATTFQAQAMMA